MTNETLDSVERIKDVVYGLGFMAAIGTGDPTLVKVLMDNPEKPIARIMVEGRNVLFEYNNIGKRKPETFSQYKLFEYLNNLERRGYI